MVYGFAFPPPSSLLCACNEPFGASFEICYLCVAWSMEEIIIIAICRYSIPTITLFRKKFSVFCEIFLDVLSIFFVGMISSLFVFFVDVELCVARSVRNGICAKFTLLEPQQDSLQNQCSNSLQAS
jgi:hypothetical protein